MYNIGTKVISGTGKPGVTSFNFFRNNKTGYKFKNFSEIIELESQVKNFPEVTKLQL